MGKIIQVTIRVDTAAFRKSLRRIRRKLRWVRVHLAITTFVDDARIWLRPGLAPEIGLGRRGTCPWLSRTAGQIIWRPLFAEQIVAKLARAIQRLVPPMQQMGLAAAQAQAAFQSFGAAMGTATAAAAKAAAAFNGSGRVH